MNRKRTLKLALLGSLLTVSFGAFSQTTINAASNSATINGQVYDYSIGEMTLVSTERSAGLIVTQGYLQPAKNNKGSVDDGSNLNTLTSNIKVYPNPTENILFVESLETSSGEMSYQLLDATGKVVINKHEILVEGTNRIKLDLSALAAATYFLVLNKANQESYSYKIQKTN